MLTRQAFTMLKGIFKASAKSVDQDQPQPSGTVYQELHYLLFSFY